MKTTETHGIVKPCYESDIFLIKKKGFGISDTTLPIQYLYSIQLRLHPKFRLVNIQQIFNSAKSYWEIYEYERCELWGYISVRLLLLFRGKYGSVWYGCI